MTGGKVLVNLWFGYSVCPNDVTASEGRLVACC